MFEGLLQPMHLLLILGLCLIFFGPSKLPELGKSLGTSIRGFRDAFNGAGEPETPRLEAGDKRDGADEKPPT
ncbi:MAG TPA: twin-arginine translocase TatA/TatE family subunit [Thermoanaerobaculia bacterium]|nr:twin-arginine translocase TatA/TatE family subunit [Thermoanaerobaculia bacterium]